MYGYSGGSRGGVRGACPPTPPLLLDQTAPPLSQGLDPGLESEVSSSLKTGELLIEM